MFIIVCACARACVCTCVCVCLCVCVCDDCNMTLCCYGRFYDILSTMMSEGGKAPINVVHDQEEIQVHNNNMTTVCMCVYA